MAILTTFSCRIYSSWTKPETKPVRPAAGIMFDCIQLEAGSLITNAVPQFRQGEHSGTGLNMSGDGGIPPAEYHLAETTNLSQPGWIRIQTNTFDHSGLFAISNLTESESGFYRIEMD